MRPQWVPVKCSWIYLSTLKSECGIGIVDSCDCCSSLWEYGSIVFLMRWVQRTHVHFFCLPKRNEPKKKAPDDLPLAVAMGALRFSPFPARVNSWALPTQTCTRLFPEKAVMLGGVNGIGVH